uniref:Uncharacterized protein n=1 Tax=Romanomermis culicivorax TaxID=13658 RepID=A0A915KMU2_ROMCU
MLRRETVFQDIQDALANYFFKMADPQANAQNAGTSRKPAVANVAANAQAGVAQNTVPILVGQPLPHKP